MDWNKIRMLESLGLCQKWQLCLKQDGMHPEQKPLESVLHLRLWPDGGVTGVVERDKGLGDIFGHWDMKSICFFILNRPRTRFMDKVEGNWTEKGKYTDISEGRISCISNSGSPQTMGTLKMHVLDTSEGDEKNVMEKAFDDSFMNNLREYIMTQPVEQHFYDFQIVCNDNTEVKCHKIIIASQTKYFEGLFRQQRSDQIQLDFQSDAVKTCIRYLYTEDLSITGDNVQDILVVANYLLLPKIVRRCVSYILANMDISNCIDILNLGDQLNMPEISSEASDAISFSLGSVFEDENNFKNTPLHLFKSLLSNENVTLKNSRKVTMTDTKKKVPLADIARIYCTKTNQTGEVEGLLGLINQLPETRNFYQRFKSHRFGTYSDRPRVIRHFDLKRTEEDYIQAVTLKTSIWDNRPLVSGMVLKWTDGTEDEVGEGEVAAVYKVPDGEHISFVFGASGWYVDKLTFVLSNGKFLGGSIGGDGGSFQNSLETLPRNLNMFNCLLTGIEGRVVESQGVPLITGIKFLYSGDISEDETLIEFHGHATHAGHHDDFQFDVGN